ncbi:MAG: hypothetical protein NW208_18390 [Bryobacter sp.]|nr:hypothetical protein [Bryobacter sp.]
MQLIGDGTAIRAAARLLEKAGLAYGWTPGKRPPLPVILLGEAAMELMGGALGLEALREGMYAVKERRVRWGGETLRLPHRAWVTSETELLGRLGVPHSMGSAQGPRLLAAGIEEGGTREIAAGARRAELVRVKYREAHEVVATEAVDEGWLFTLPTESGAGWLIGVGGAVETLLGQSQLVGPMIEAREGETLRFESAPRLRWPLWGEDWLACGSAAARFDPICGDGTAFAVREAILAAAVLREGFSGEARMHYAARLLAAFAKHLALARQYYADGPPTDWWRAQVADTEKALRWCEAELAALPAPRFRLVGEELVAI